MSRATVKMATPSMLARPALETRLDEAFGKRLTLLVAGPGFGKSTLLAAWAKDLTCAWYTLSARDARLPTLARGLADAVRRIVPAVPADLATTLEVQATEPSADAFAGYLCERLEQSLDVDLILVVDDLHELQRDSAPANLIESLCRHAPPTLHLMLASRAEPPFSIARLRGRGEVLEFDASDLAFSAEEIEMLVESELGPHSEAIARPLHEETRGWPAAVRLAVEALRHVPAAEREAALERLRHPEGPLLSYLAEEVLENEEPAVRDLLRRVACVGPVNPSLCKALDLPDAPATLAALARRGLLVQTEGGGGDWYSLHALLGEFLRERWPLEKRELRSLQRRAARWFAANGQPTEALRCSMGAEHSSGIALLLAERGTELLAAGGADSVLRAADLVDHEDRTEQVEQTLGEAYALKGAWEAALACFRHAAGQSEMLPPAIAARLVRIHYDRGDLAEALRTARQGVIDGSNPREESLLLGLMAQTQRVLGDVEASRVTLDDQRKAAVESADPRALAAAHANLMVDAMTRDDHSAAEEHYGRAREAAVASGTPAAILRVHAERAAQLGGREALAELDDALRLAELTGAEVHLGALLHERGNVLSRLGSFEDAASDLTRATAILERAGSKRACWPLAALGDVYRERGQLARARAAYEKALGLADAAAEVQGRIASRSGLSRVLARQDPQAAKRFADEAVDLARAFGIDRVWALVSAGWVQLACSDRERAEGLAEEAEAAARRQPQRGALAEALELRALSAVEPAGESALLDQARAIWREEGNAVGESRAELALGLLSPSAARGTAQRAAQRLRAAGVSISAAALAAGPLAFLPREAQPDVAIRALGGFVVLRHGRPVPVPEWRSKKARDLLQILVSRRGRAVPRDFLMEALWPEQDPSKLGNRLSVALSMLRAVLDPDHRFGQEHFVAGDRQTVTLNTRHVATDVEDFSTDAETGLTLRAQDDAHARDLLTAAEAAYAGDFLEEVYEDWAVSPRERLRSLYVDVVRALAGDVLAEATTTPRVATCFGSWSGTASTNARTWILLERSPAQAGTERRAARTASTANEWPRSASKRLRTLAEPPRLSPLKGAAWTIVAVETFVIRLWTPAGDESPASDPPALRGTVERAASSEAQSFHSGEELLELLRAGLVGTRS